MKIYQVDAFTHRPFAGNPAAVCIMNEQRDETWLQNVAREMNLSETAFLTPGDVGYNLRWFTPGSEVDLCGHATLAAAHILWERGYLDRQELASFHSKSGLLTAKFTGGWIEMDFPALPVKKTNPPAELVRALGVNPVYVGKSKFDYLVEVASEAEVRGMQPDFTMLLQVPMRGVIVTSLAASGDYDFVSRFFAPEVGVFEDPVTGSAHCSLGPYWMNKLQKDRFTAYQASERGGTVKVQVAGDRVLLAGQAVTVLEAELLE